MTSSNRVVNRIILGLVGAILLVLAAAGAVGAAGLSLPWLDRVGLGRGSALASGKGVGVDADWYIAAAALVAILLALAWILTRGRGRTSRIIRLDSPDGSVEFDRHYVEDALAARLDAQRDVTRVTVAAFRRGRARICKLTVTVRRGGDVASVTAAVRDAIAELDAELGMSVPILTQLVATPVATTARAA
jgi:hypothetical protein